MQKNITSLGSLNWDDLKFFLEVARTRKASVAAKRLAVDYTTVSRRISSLEVSLGTLLFEKSRTNGFVLTTEGQRLLGYAESIESTLHMACEQVSGSGVALSGHVRMGCTEGFGSFFITPQLSHFVDAYPAVVEKFVAAQQPAVQWLTDDANKDAYIQLVSERASYPPAILQRDLSQERLSAVFDSTLDPDFLARLQASDLSKYNLHDPALAPPAPGYVLVIDQTVGDAALTHDPDNAAHRVGSSLAADDAALARGGLTATPTSGPWRRA